MLQKFIRRLRIKQKFIRVVYLYSKCTDCRINCFIFIPVLLLCYVSRSSLYSNIPSYLCSLCLPCYYFYIVLSLYLYCCYVIYPDHHYTVIYLQTCVLCVCLVIISTLFYLYACIVVMLCI